MLEDGRISAMFAGIPQGIYGPGSLVTVVTGTTRDQSTGVFPVAQTTTPVRVQRDVCTQRQMSQAGYSEKDVRLMVLQHGVAVTPNTDSLVVHRGETFAVMDVDEDPCRVYWDLRARRRST